MMREVPDYFWQWTEMDWNTGKRIVKPDTPPDILKKLIDDERSEFEITGRRCITNINI